MDHPTPRHLHQTHHQAVHRSIIEEQQHQWIEEKSRIKGQQKH
jgi:hypothetical protein